MRETRNAPSDGRSRDRRLAWPVVFVIVGLLVVAFFVTLARRQPTDDSSTARTAPTEGRKPQAGAPPGQKSEPAPGIRVDPPPVAPPTTGQPHHPDPFKAFVEASKSGQRPLSAGPAAGPPAGQAAERDDPFRSIAEKTKNRGEEVTRSPFGR